MFLSKPLRAAYFLAGVTVGAMFYAQAAAVKLAVPASISPLGKLCTIAALAFMLAGFAHFLDFTQSKGEIFRSWRAWTFRTFWFKGRARRAGWLYSYEGRPVGVQQIYAPCCPYSDWTVRRFWRPASAWRQGLYKVLGGCIYCSSVWVGSFFYFTGAAALAVPFWLMLWGWPLFIGAQFVYIDLLFYAQKTVTN